MTHTEETFLEIYRCALQGNAYEEKEKGPGEESGKKREAGYRQVLALADSHRVFPMVLEASFPALEKHGPDSPMLRRWLEKAKELTCGQARMTAEFLKLYRFLKRRSLSPLVMKGITCRSLYPNPEQRSSSDEDLLIPEGSFGKYHRAFLDYGLYVAIPDIDIDKEDEVPYCNGQVYIELHKKPFPKDSKAYGDLNRFFTDVEDRAVTENFYGIGVRTMGHTDHIFYQICHAYKHFLNCGIGIRLVSDIVLYSIVHELAIDWETIINRCREIHALDFVRAIYRIGQTCLFPDSFPEGMRNRWNTEGVDDSPLLMDVLKGGVYGTSSEERLHSANITLAAIESEKKGSRPAVMMKTLFPSAASLYGRYPYLRRYPFLLPIAWARRLLGYGLAGIRRRDGARRMTEAVRIGNERVELMRRYSMLGEKKKQKEKNPLKRLYRWSHKSALAPVLSPVYAFVSMVEYHVLELIWYLNGHRMPTEEERELVRRNVTFIAKSFERQHLARGLCRNISRMYPGASVIIADDSREPLEIGLANVRVLQLPFNSGLCAGLQAALAEVDTPYVMRLDDDELLTVRSKVHRELRYLMRHPELDLIGFGHTTAIRLHSPEFNFKEYYKCPMEDAPRPLKVPHMTRIDENHMVLGKVANIYLARTEKLREVGFDSNIRVIDHHEFFWRAAGVITSAAALDTVVFHRHNPYEKGYNSYRSDYAADLEYIKKKRKRILKEADNERT